MDGETRAPDFSAQERTEKTRANNRRVKILDAAAYRFRRQGYAATTMREVAADAGMLAGSLYYHFPSKRALLLAVHDEAVARIAGEVAGAVEGCSSDDPWDRLTAALAAHMESLLTGGDYAQVVIRDLPADDEELRADLTRLRDGYEAQFKDLVAALPVDAKRKSAIRLMLLGAANWSKTWYSPDGDAPAVIAQSFIDLIRT